MFSTSGRDVGENFIVGHRPGDAGHQRGEHLIERLGDRRPKLIHHLAPVLIQELIHGSACKAKLSMLTSQINFNIIWQKIYNVAINGETNVFF